MNDKQLNANESLELIAKMIKNTQQKLERNSGLPFLIWGYITFATSIVVWYLLKTTGNMQWNWLWFAIPVLGYPIMLLSIRKQNQTVTTYLDKVIWYIWIVFGIATFFVCVQIRFFSAEYNYIPVLYCIALLMGIATAITGLIIKFKPCVVSGFLGIALSQLCLMKSVHAVLIFGFIFLLMMIIPGHVLNYKARKQC